MAVTKTAKAARSAPRTIAKSVAADPFGLNEILQGRSKAELQAIAKQSGVIRMPKANASAKSLIEAINNHASWLRYQGEADEIAKHAGIGPAGPSGPKADASRGGREIAEFQKRLAEAARITSAPPAAPAARATSRKPVVSRAAATAKTQKFLPVVGPIAVFAAAALAFDATRSQARAAGADKMAANVSATKSAVVAGGATAIVGAGLSAAVSTTARAAVAAGIKASFLTPVGLAVAGAVTAYGAVQGYRKTGTVAGAALGAVTGGEVFEGMKRPGSPSDVQGVRTALAVDASNRAAQTMLRAHADLAPHRTAAAPRATHHVINRGWSDQARIASAIKRGVAPPGTGDKGKAPL